MTAAPRGEGGEREPDRWGYARGSLVQSICDALSGASGEPLGDAIDIVAKIDGYLYEYGIRSPRAMLLESALAAVADFVDGVPLAPEPTSAPPPSPVVAQDAQPVVAGEAGAVAWGGKMPKRDGLIAGMVYTSEDEAKAKVLPWFPNAQIVPLYLALPLRPPRGEGVAGKGE